MNTDVLKTPKKIQIVWKCDDQYQYKDIIESAMVSATEGFTDNSPISSGPSVPVKQPNVMKSHHKFSETLGVKPKIDVLWLCDAKSNLKSIIAFSMLWSNIPNQWGNTKSLNVLKDLFTIGLYNILRL